ncbi:MAG: DinB family protein [Dehalococcoidia bacterium]|jgi:uncharacterized damage-inducible protein DinB|nr:DinB family protein [Dehalococcoidia bacterium]MDP7083843.1 DinB family protein [Dehalococcoidia bacterium]MDP7201031.1 DinB family protein [Dehalococcoidia bacterium]MDP7510546.1 DinB family protein [Dehalococcoidia bacterium]HJN87076.1 DinB family protein [Dehalococcoidia bacterium]
MSNNEIQELQEGLRSAREAVLSAIEGISEAEAKEVPEPGEWTVAQLMGHITEVQSFWVSKAILITREDDPNVARNAAEGELRTASVAGMAQHSVADLRQKMIAANDAAVATVGGIDPKDLNRLGHRGEGKSVSAGQIVQSVASHLREHAGQITETRRIVRERQ